MAIYDPSGMSAPSPPTASEPRSPKGRRTRARLLEAAKTVFERDGFLNARVSDISEAAGLSHGSFYHYFDTKEQIFRELAQALEVSVTTMHEPGEKAPPKQSPIERIRAGNRHFLEAYERDAKIMRVIEEVSAYDVELRELRVRRWHTFSHQLETSIIRLQDEGLADKMIEPRYAADALGCMVAKFADMWFGQGGSYDMETAIEQLTRLWTNALGISMDADAGPAPQTVPKKRIRRPR